MKEARLLPGTFLINYEGGCATLQELFLRGGPGQCSCVFLLGGQLHLPGPPHIDACLGRRKQHCFLHVAHLWGNLPGNLALP